MIVSFEDIADYSQVAMESRMMAEIQIEAAQEIVENYLGYELIQEAKTVELDGNGEKEVNLSSPILSFTAVSVDDEEQDLSDFYPSGELLCWKESRFPRGERNISVTFTGGFSADDVPRLIKLTVMRIAMVLINESAGMIGISSVSDPNTGSRTFMERKFDKYLLPIAPFRTAPW